MAEDEKPFKCYQPDCGMRFTNEDHLSVHEKKHDMSLALNLGGGLGGLSPMGLCDQTPTPTKFLKNCEELGLFQELSKNPFDDSFKKALDVPEDETDASGLPGPAGMITLDTPLVNTVPKIVTDHSFDDVKSPTKTKENTLSSIVPKKREKFLSSHVLPTSTTSEDEEMPSASSSNIGNEVQHSEEIIADSVDEFLGDGAEVMAVTSSDGELIEPVPEIPLVANTVKPDMESKPAIAPASHVTMQALLQLPNGQTIPVQLPGSVLAQPQVVPVQTVSPLKNISAVPQASLHGNVQGNTQYIQTVPTTIIQQKPVIQGAMHNLPGTVQSVPVMVQNSSNRIFPLQSVKLGPSPLAQTSQVQTGNQTLVTNVISPEKQAETQNPGIKTVIAPQIVVQSAPKRTVISHKSQNQSTSKSSPNQGSQTYTKQRLKAALQSNITPSSSMKINHIFKIVEEVKQEQQQHPIVSQDSLSVVSDTISSPEDAATPAKQMRTEAEDSEEKRKKFLERNRAAAARCRQKRKSWIYNLESKAEELSSVNNKLQSEIKSLRGEVAHLKQLLIAHKDCPITIQQQSQGQMFPQPSPSTGSQSPDVDLETIEILPAITNGDISTANDIQNVITVDPGTVGSSVSMATSVLTGSNSVAMIPTLVNLDFYAKNNPS